VPGASKPESTDNTSRVADVNVPTRGSDASVEVPCNSELHNESLLDSSTTPKAASLHADDTFSTTSVDETANVTVTENDVSDLKQPSPLSEESRDDYTGDASEQPSDVADDQFVSASEGESLPLFSS